MTLDWWGKPYSDPSGGVSYISVSVSADGIAWKDLLNTPVVYNDPYKHWGYSLDAQGLTYTADTQVRFRHTEFFSYAWDDIRVAENIDVFGARVVSQTPAGTLCGPVSSFSVTFNEPISSLAASAVTVTGPGGDSVPLSPTNAIVDSGDHKTFTINLATPQALAGHYAVNISADVLDISGNRMDQNGDGLQGDGYSGGFDIAAAQVNVYPFSEGFEAGSLGALGPYWSFARTAGSISVGMAHPNSGLYALQMIGPAAPPYDQYQEAILHLNLLGQSHVTLDFWHSVYNSGGVLEIAVSMSSDGSVWKNLLTQSASTYAHQVFDLDAQGLAYTADTQIRFRHTDFSSYAWDDIRVAENIDVFGARVISQTPTGTVGGTVGSVSVTFNEPISSFPASAVTVTGPGGNAVALSGTNPIVDSGDHKTFTINLATPQVLGGHYTVSVGPNVLDMAGNVMNQNNDALQGDGYSGSLDLTATPAALPVTQGFESGDLGTLAGWSVVCNGGSVAMSSASPEAGAYALQISSSSNNTSYYGDAVLHVDLLNGTVPATGVVLDFWLKEVSGGGRTDDFSVSFSTNGSTWTTPAELTFAGSSTWQHFPFSMDSLGLAYTHDVQIKFHHNSYYAGTFVMDDVRVRANALPLNHAPTLTAVNTLTGATNGQPMAISYASLAAAGNQADADGNSLSFQIMTVTSGALHEERHARCSGRYAAWLGRVAQVDTRRHRGGCRGIHSPRVGWGPEFCNVRSGECRRLPGRWCPAVRRLERLCRGAIVRQPEFHLGECGHR